MAASATLALKAGACVRRVRFVIIAPDPRHSRRSQAGFPLNELSEFGQPPLVMLGRSNASPLRVSDGPAVRRVGRRPAILAGVADLGIRDMLGRGSEWY